MEAETDHGWFSDRHTIGTRACARISIACMDTDPAKRPNTEVIMDILAQTEIRDKGEKSSSAMPVAKVSLWIIACYH